MYSRNGYTNQQKANGYQIDRDVHDFRHVVIAEWLARCELESWHPPFSTILNHPRLFVAGLCNKIHCY